MLTQVAAAGIAGGTFGYALTAVIAEPVIRAAFDEGAGELAEIPIISGPLTAVVTVGSTVALTLLGGARAARSAVRTPPLSALREPEPRAKPMRWWRWIVFACVCALAAWFGASLLNVTNRQQHFTFAPLVPAVLTAVVASAGPAIYAVLLRAWTGVLPARASTAWHLARHEARYHLSRSTASVTPLFAGTAVLGGLYTVLATTNASFAGTGEGAVALGSAQVALMFGSPILLAVTGAAVVIFMSNRSQGTGQALPCGSSCLPPKTGRSSCRTVHQWQHGARYPESMTDASLVNRYRSLAARVYAADKPIGRSFGDVELYTELLRGVTGPVLEPAAGNGRVLVPLAEAGLELVGTDPSADMLDRCRAECDARGLSVGLELGRFDTVDPEARYAAIIVPAGSIQLVLDPAQTREILAGFCAALMPGGRLIFDLDSLHALAETAPGARSWRDGDDLLTLTTVTESVDVAAQTTMSQLRYERWHGGALAETELEQFALRLWGVNEMLLLLEAVGFTEVRVHADYERDSAPSESTRVVTFEAVRG